MKTRFSILSMLPILLSALMAIFFMSCDEDEPKTLPVVTTADVTDITTTTAMGGGEITDNGNATVTASGLVYSSTNATPTIDDSKTELTVATGAFTSLMESLNSGTVYHVRAYATNSVGTGYGETVDFTTGNAAPVAATVTVTGTAQVPETLTATYAYSDSENDAEGASTFQWYVANDGAGSGETAIAGATALTYKLKDTDEFKFVRFGVTPIAATGTASGIEVKSAFAGPVAEEPTTVTFNYNGASVTYGIIISSTTGRRWMDRNLGAPNAPTATNDFANYGDLFQWGRGADGHQRVNRGATNAATTGVNGNTTTLSTADDPGHALFIINGTVDPYDWRNPGNNNLWQGVNGINNPCPAGWRLPTKEEWQTESFTTLASAFTQLKITLGGRHNESTGNFTGTTTVGGYWSTTPLTNVLNTTGVAYLQVSNTAAATLPVNGGVRASGMSCRCIKNE